MHRQDRGPITAPVHRAVFFVKGEAQGVCNKQIHKELQFCLLLALLPPPNTNPNAKSCGSEAPALPAFTTQMIQPLPWKYSLVLSVISMCPS